MQFYDSKIAELLYVFYQKQPNQAIKIIPNGSSFEIMFVVFFSYVKEENA